MNKFLNIDELKLELENLKQGEVYKFKIMVNASAKDNSISFDGEYIKIRIKEKAVDGKANKGIIEYLSEILKFPKSKISITQGNTSRIKTIQIKK